jgi:predicted MFS family arabinose efflux permease
MGIGVALGVALGLPLGLAINAAMGDAGSGMAIGPAMGVAIGVAIGTALEQRHRGETRPLTNYEKRARRWTTWVGIAVLVLLAAIGVIGAVVWLLR